MNFVINMLMQYTQIQFKILGSLRTNEDILDKHTETGSIEEAFAEYIEKVDEEAKKWIPKSITLVGHISMLISIAEY